jgi:hypothetical protein
MAMMAKYVRYLFNLQHNTSRTVIQQCMHLAAYEEHATATSHELERMMHDNAILHHGTVPPSNQDWELQVEYRHLNEAKDGWNFTHRQLDLIREVVDTYTNVIIHFEHAIEQQDLKLKERAVTIATLKQQLQVVQLQTPPTPEAPTEPDAVSDVNEE